jgi:hypothetical protein
MLVFITCNNQSSHRLVQRLISYSFQCPAKDTITKLGGHRLHPVRDAKHLETVVSQLSLNSRLVCRGTTLRKDLYCSTSTPYIPKSHPRPIISFENSSAEHPVPK